MKIDDEISVLGQFDSDGIFMPHSSLDANWLWLKGEACALRYNLRFNGMDESESWGHEDRLRYLSVELIRLMRAGHKYHEEMYHEPYFSILMKNRS